jgi:hypothetical protein
LDPRLSGRQWSYWNQQWKDRCFSQCVAIKLTTVRFLLGLLASYMDNVDIMLISINYC